MNVGKTTIPQLATLPTTQTVAPDPIPGFWLKLYKDKTLTTKASTQYKFYVGAQTFNDAQKLVAKDKGLMGYVASEFNIKIPVATGEEIIFKDPMKDGRESAIYNRVTQFNPDGTTNYTLNSINFTGGSLETRVVVDYNLAADRNKRDLGYDKHGSLVFYDPIATQKNNGVLVLSKNQTIANGDIFSYIPKQEIERGKNGKAVRDDGIPMDMIVIGGKFKRFVYDEITRDPVAVVNKVNLNATERVLALETLLTFPESYRHFDLLNKAHNVVPLSSSRSASVQQNIADQNKELKQEAAKGADLYLWNVYKNPEVLPYIEAEFLKLKGVSSYDTDVRAEAYLKGVDAYGKAVDDALNDQIRKVNTSELARAIAEIGVINKKINNLVKINGLGTKETTASKELNNRYTTLEQLRIGIESDDKFLASLIKSYDANPTKERYERLKAIETAIIKRSEEHKALSAKYNEDIIPHPDKVKALAQVKILQAQAKVIKDANKEAFATIQDPNFLKAIETSNQKLSSINVLGGASIGFTPVLNRLSLEKEVVEEGEASYDNIFNGALNMLAKIPYAIGELGIKLGNGIVFLKDVAENPAMMMATGGTFKGNRIAGEFYNHVDNQYAAINLETASGKKLTQNTNKFFNPVEVESIVELFIQAAPATMGGSAGIAVAGLLGTHVMSTSYHYAIKNKIENPELYSFISGAIEFLTETTMMKALRFSAKPLLGKAMTPFASVAEKIPLNKWKEIVNVGFDSPQGRILTRKLVSDYYLTTSKAIGRGLARTGEETLEEIVAHDLNVVRDKVWNQLYNSDIVSTVMGMNEVFDLSYKMGIVQFILGGKRTIKRFIGGNPHKDAIANQLFIEWGRGNYGTVSTMIKATKELYPSMTGELDEIMNNINSFSLESIPEGLSEFQVAALIRVSEEKKKLEKQLGTLGETFKAHTQMQLKAVNNEVGAILDGTSEYIKDAEEHNLDAIGAKMQGKAKKITPPPPEIDKMPVVGYYGVVANKDAFIVRTSTGQLGLAFEDGSSWSKTTKEHVLKGQIEKTTTALAKLPGGVQVKIHNTTEEFNADPALQEHVIKAAKTGGVIQGWYARGKDNIIYINFEAMMAAKGSPGTILFHEGTHPILDILESLSPGTIDVLFDQIKSAEIQAGVEGVISKDVIERYKRGGYDSATQKAEAITEFIARATSGQIKLSTSLFEKTKRIFVGVMNRLGVDVSGTVRTTEDLTKLANQIKDAFETGTPIEIWDGNISGIKQRPSLTDTRQQIKEFGAPEQDVEATHGLLVKVFEGLKKTGLTAAKSVSEWVTIGKGTKSGSALQNEATSKIRSLSEILGFDLGNELNVGDNSLKSSNQTELPQNTPISNGFNIFKKKYGESAAKAIREHIPIALEYPNEFVEYLTKIIPIKEDIAFIVKGIGARIEAGFRLSVDKGIKTTSVKSTPEELSKKAGYSFHRPENLNELLVFKKDFENGEVLCTFNNPEGRMGGNFIFWIRRPNAESVLHSKQLTQGYLESDSEGARLWRGYLEEKGRKNKDGTFNISNIESSRQDPYGTSSMSVQIGRKNGEISIKNRYNHTVNNPDATFGNDLNNITDGLHDAVYAIEGVPTNKGQQLNLPDNIVSDSGGSFMKSEKEFNNVHINKNGYMKGGVIHIIDKESQRMIDDYIIDVKKKTFISVANNESTISDITKITFEKNKVSIETKYGILHFLLEDGILNSVSGDATTIGNSFLYYNDSLTEISLPNVTTIGDYFLHYNDSLTELSLPNATTIGNSFLYYNESLKEISLPNATTIGYNFLHYNKSLKEISLPNITNIGDYFLYRNESLTELSLPNITNIGNSFLYRNESLTELSLPNATTIGYNFLDNNNSLKEISLPNATTIGNSFLYYNESLKEISLPNATTIGNSFLYYNESLKEISLPNITNIGDYFLYSNESLTELSLPNATTIGNNFLHSNESLTELSLPNATTIGYNFLDYNKNVNKEIVVKKSPLFKDSEAQYRIESGKNLIEAIKNFNGSRKATVALTHEIIHPTVVAIIDGAKDGNEIGVKHTKTIADEFNKANPKSKVTIEGLISANDAFKNGTTTDQYRAVQEFIADSWEKYHLEGGKGFSEAFQAVLEQIMQAFRDVYKSISGKNLTPELRKMFDEILGIEGTQSLPTPPKADVVGSASLASSGDTAEDDIMQLLVNPLGATKDNIETTFTKIWLALHNKPKVLRAVMVAVRKRAIMVSSMREVTREITPEMLREIKLEQAPKAGSPIKAHYDYLTFLSSRLSHTAIRATAAQTIMGMIAAQHKMTPKEAHNLTSQLGFQEMAVEDLKKVIGEIRKAIVVELRKVKKSGTVPAKDVVALIKGFPPLEKLSTEAVSEYLLKVSEALSASAHRKDIATALKKSATIASAIKNKKLMKWKDGGRIITLAKRLIRLGKNHLSIDITTYLSMQGNMIMALHGDITNKTRVPRVLDYVAFEKYLNEQEAMFRDLAKESLLEKYNYLVEVGIIDGEMSLDEVKELIALIDDSESPSSLSREEKESKEFQATQTLLPLYNMVAALTQKMIEDRAASSSGVQVTDIQYIIMEKLLAVPVTPVNIQQINAIIEAMQNFLTNGVTNKAEAIHYRVEGENNLEDDIARKIRNKPITFLSPLFGVIRAGSISRYLGRQWREHLSPMPFIFEGIFGIRGAPIVVNNSGLQDFVEGSVKGTKEFDAAATLYAQATEKLREGGSKFYDLTNIYERGVYAYLIRDTHKEGEFSKRERRLVDSAVKLNKAGAHDRYFEMKNPYIAALERLGIITFIDGVVKEVDSYTTEMLENNVRAMNKMGVKMMIAIHAPHFERLNQISEGYYDGETLVESTNYTTDGYLFISEAPLEIQDTSPESDFYIPSLLTVGKTKSLFKKRKFDKLPDNMIVNLNFDLNNLAVLKGALVEINTASALAQMKGYFNSPRFKEIVKYENDRNMLIRRLDTYTKEVKAHSSRDTSDNKTARRWLNRLSALSVSKVLGGITTPIAQTVPMLANTLMMTMFSQNTFKLSAYGEGGPVIALVDVLKNLTGTPSYHAWVDKLNLPISIRGAETEVTVELHSKIQRIMDLASQGKLSPLWIVSKLEDTGRWYLNNTLVKPDRFIARAAFATFYKLELIKKGIETGDIDWATHETDMEAARAADREVSRSQGVSDAMMRGTLLTSKKIPHVILQKTVLAFMTYVLSMKTRAYDSMSGFITEGEERPYHLRSLGGVVAEAATFNAIKSYFGYLFADLWMGLLGDDESDRKKMWNWAEERDKRIKKLIYNTFLNTGIDLLSPIGLTNNDISRVLDLLFRQLITKPEDYVPVPSLLGFKHQTPIAGVIGVAGGFAQQIFHITQVISNNYVYDYYNAASGLIETKQLSVKDSEYYLTAAIVYMAYALTGLLPKEAGFESIKIMRLLEKQGNRTDVTITIKVDKPIRKDKPTPSVGAGKWKQNLDGTWYRE